MDQTTRPDLSTATATNGSGNGTGHQQNVHLHMHHVCACQGLYPSTYYPPLGYRTPLISYAAAPQTAVARPYLQHYQYTQFNVGGQYGVPVAQLAATYGAAAGGAAGGEGGAVALAARDRPPRERGEEAAAAAPECEKGHQHEPPTAADFDFASIVPPVNELFMMSNSEEFQMNTDNFIKFLERSCLTAEQIAYRNRNRPCFRNIQNLCIRTRSEILKPRTTISNIHSQGIPWATKDFIYAFVRLTNCWHILKGYWENRDGSALGKIEKELGPGFKACYVRWEKETVELATELTRIFYNLDVNQSNPGPATVSSSASVHTANNLVPPQVNLLKAPADDSASKKTLAPSTVTSSSSNATIVVPTSLSTASISAKNVRGILHLPSSTSAVANNNNNNSTETVDQANQTCSGDFCGKSDAEIDTDDENGNVYMKPGSYRVPKKYKNKESLATTNNKSSSPRVIEFLETAQNISKGLEAANDKYWVKVKTSLARKGAEPAKLHQADDILVPDGENASEAFFNVHEWLSNSNFSDYAERSSTSTSPPKCGGVSCFPDLLDEVATNLDTDKSGNSISHKKSRCLNNNNNNGKSLEQITSRTYRRKTDLSNVVYETKGGGLTKRGKNVLEKIVADLRATELVGTLHDCVLLDCVSLDSILKNLNRDVYRYVCEVVRDLRIVANNANQHFKGCEVTEEQVKAFLRKLDSCLGEYFANYDFGGIVGARGEKVGKLMMKSKKSISDGDCDHLKNSN